VSYNFLDIFPTFPSDDGWYAVIGNSMGRGGGHCLKTKVIKILGE